MLKVNEEIILAYQEIVNICDELDIEFEIHNDTICLMYKDVIMDHFEDLNECIIFLKGFEWKNKFLNS